MRVLRRSAIALLVFLGLGALFGGAMFLSDPDGSRWHMMPVSMLRYSPFHSWLIPGLILFAANGLLALYIAWRVMRQRPRYGLWTALQGFVLLGFLATECVMLRVVMWLHWFYAGVGVALIAVGFALHARWARDIPRER